MGTQSGVKGTPLWMAPEVIKEQQTDKGWRRADVWSVGCTIIEMATGRPPWSQYSNPVTAMYHIACVETVPPFPETLAAQGHAFLKRCFVRDPANRPTVTDLLLDPFVTQLPAAQVRHLSNTSFPQRPTTGGGRRGSGRPRSSQYHMMSSSVQRLSRDTSSSNNNSSAVVNDKQILPSATSATSTVAQSATIIVSPSPLTVPGGSPPASAGQTSGEVVRSEKKGSKFQRQEPGPIRMRQYPDKNPSFQSNKKKNNKNNNSHNSHNSSEKKRSRKRNRSQKKKENEQEQELASSSSLITHAVIATPRVSLFDGIESDDEELEDENHFGGMGGLRVRTDNQELVAAEEVDEDDLMNEFDGPPTPREILEAAKIAAASGSPLNLANHDSPRGDISPNTFSDNNHSMQQQQQQQHQQLQAPPAVSVPIFDRSPRPDEDDTTIAEEVVEEEVFGGDHKEESDDEEVNEEEMNEEEVEEAIMNNSKLTDDLNEFREQLGITPRHTPQYAAGFVEDTADTAVIHSANQGYQYSAAPMTPRR